MSGLAKSIRNFKAFKTVFGKDRWISRFKTLKDHKIKVATGVGVVLTGCWRNYDVIYAGYKWCANQYTSFAEERARRKMIGIDIAHGLAWSHYCGYLQYVLPDINKKIEESKWYQGLSNKDRGKVPKKLYELIPRKCYVDIPGMDENVQHESELIIEVDRAGNRREIKVQIYSIKDGETKYYCLCDCPYVLKTINNVNDIQLAGISRSKVQLFTVDRKMVQIMRFYYAMSSLLCLKNNTENARLLLFNESDRKLSNVLIEAIKEDLNVNRSEQKTHGSLMEENLLSTEEIKDVFYDFDVFVTHPEEVTCKGELETISQKLKKKKMKILLEKDCLGKDWLEKIKYAATKCRWIVLLDKKGSESKSFMSSNVVASLKNILESKKVQTVAIVNKRDQLHINEDLRWVTCIPYHDNKKHLVDTLYKVVSGLEVKLKNSEDLYLRPGEAAVGLAWGYAVNYLNKVLPELGKQITQMKDGIEKPIILKDKLFIVIPKSCQTSSSLPGVEPFKHTESSPTNSRSYQFNVYELGKSKYFVGQYAAPVDVIRQMKETGLLDEKQMKLEVANFYDTVQNIMRILFPEKADSYEFIYYDDTKEPLSAVLSKSVK